MLPHTKTTRAALLHATLALAISTGACGKTPANETQTPPAQTASGTSPGAASANSPSEDAAAAGGSKIAHGAGANAWSQEARTLARHTLDAVRGSQHEAAITILWPDRPAASPTDAVRLVLVGGAAGHADETLTVIERDAEGAWAARGERVHERISGNGAAASVVNDLRISTEEFDLRFEAAQLVLLARFVRTDGKETAESRSGGTDEYLYYVRIDEAGTCTYERCRENDVLEDGLRAAAGLKHDTLFALFSGVLAEGDRSLPLTTARWQHFLERELGRVQRGHLSGSRDGLARLAQSVVVQAAESAGPGAVAHFERLGLTAEAQILRLQSAWDATWAESFLRRRYEWDREERALARRIRDAYREQAPDAYVTFLGGEAKSCAKDLDAVREVVAELGRLGTRARPVLVELMRNDDASVRVDSAIAILAGDPGDAEAGAFLDGFASDPAETGVVWRHFDISPRRVALAHLLESWDLDRIRKQLARTNEDARVIGLLCDALAERGEPVADAEQTRLYRRVLTEPTTHGTLHAVKRLVELDDRESFTPLKDKVGELAKLSRPATWSTIDESNWRNDLSLTDSTFWKWLAQRRKSQ